MTESTTVNAESTAFLAAIVQSSHDAIIGKDLAGLIVTWNPGAERLYGYSADEAIGEYSTILVTEEGRSAEVALHNGIAAGEHIQMMHIKRRHKSGAILDVSLSASPIVDGHGVIIGMATSSRDVGELILAESRFQGLLEAAPDATITLDESGRITLVNDQVERLFGWTRSELLGRSVEVLVPAAVRDSHPKLRASYISHPTNRPMGGAGAQLSAQRKDGSTFPADISLGYYQMGVARLVTAAVRDVTDRIAVQNALQVSEANFRQVTESTDVAFVLRNLDPPAFLYVSPGFKKIYGYDPMETNETPEATLRRIHPGDLAQSEEEYWQAAKRGQPAQTEWRIIRPDGDVRWVRATTTPVVDPDGLVRRSAGTAEDITERRLSEIALRKAHADAQTANAAKSEFLSRMSHELRTPLNSVLGFAQLLELDPLTQDQQDAVQYVLRGGRHLLALIDDVLDITKIESDRLDVSLEPVLVSELVREAIKMMSSLASTVDVTVNYDCDERSPQYVKADRRRLRQVLLNLLSNSIKYNRRGGRVDIQCSHGDEQFLDIAVRDTGCGIEPRDLPRLFIPFDRLGAQDTDIEGTGVGLALSHRLMANMGGTLLAQSSPGVGSTFTASIPTAEPLVGLLATPDISVPAAQTPPAMTNRLVYVEDNGSNIELMASLLTRRPAWHMVVARDGITGLATILEETPDLVLLDLHLPGMDGVDVLRALRADQRSANTQIIVVSADASPHQVERLLAAGADQYVTKPVDVLKILDLLDENERSRMARRR